MKQIILLTALLFSGLAFGNPGVTKNTDIGKRGITDPHQVTRCKGDSCKINTITKFNKKTSKKKISFGECVFLEESNMRVSECTTSSKKKKPKVKTVTKIKKVQKKNRLQFHVGKGPKGLKRKSNNNKTVVSEDMGAVVGMGYSRLLNEEVSVGATIFSNKTATFTFSVDY